MTLKTLLVMAMARHLVLTRRNQQTFDVSKAGRYFFTFCQPTPSSTCMFESVGFSPSKFYLKTTSPIIYTTMTKFRASKNIQQVRHAHKNIYITYMLNYLHWNSRRNYAVHALMFVNSSVSFVVHTWYSTIHKLAQTLSTPYDSSTWAYEIIFVNGPRHYWTAVQLIRR